MFECAPPLRTEFPGLGPGAGLRLQRLPQTLLGLSLLGAFSAEVRARRNSAAPVLRRLGVASGHRRSCLGGWLGCSVCLLGPAPHKEHPRGRLRPM